MITPKEIALLIQAGYPQAKVSISEQGTAPSASSIKRYSIMATLFNANVKINLGENLTLLIDDVPREILRYIPLLHPKDVKATIQLWLNGLQKYLQAEKLPLVKSLAQKYLGQEEKTEKKKNALYIYYGLFFVIITPQALFLCLKSDRRVVHHKKIEKPDDLEDFFKTAEFSAKSIKKGEIK